jgi:heparosan-N-sulfate-glucuronate 5-epimerase
MTNNPFRLRDSIKNETIFLITFFVFILPLFSAYVEGTPRQNESVKFTTIATNTEKQSENSCSSKFGIRDPVLAFDRSNIPIVDYGYVGQVYVGPERNPVTIAHQVFSDYSSYKKNHTDLGAKQSLINNANWLVNNVAHASNYSIFEYRFPWPPYCLKPPWHSAMAQAQSIQALVKAKEVTQDQKYIESAKMLLKSFFVEVRDGGVTYKTPNDGWWYEEYASSNGGKQSRVLNGMTFALLGIYEYYNYTHDTDAKFLFDKGVMELKKDLHLYSYLNGYTYYDRLGNLSPPMYHKAVVDTLSSLYKITKDQTFMMYLHKWQNYKIPSPT